MSSNETGGPAERSPSRVGHRRRRWIAVGAVVVAVSAIVTTVVLVANRDQQVGAPSAPGGHVDDHNTGHQQRYLPGIDDDTCAEHAAADLAPVANTIPAGLPPDLLRSVVLVYCDLASRRFAMADFSIGTTVDPNAFPNSEDLVSRLANGHGAAVRFADDLTASRSLADSTPAVTARSATSRQAAEVRLYARYVEGVNGGCDSRGGHIITELPPIVWHGSTGTIAGVHFTADLGTDGVWQVRLTAC